MKDYIGKIIRHINRILDVAIPGSYRAQIYFNNYITSKFSDKIASGPFSSVYYLCKNIPKKLGTYEKELHSQVEKIIIKNYSKIINIGASDGFYAVGIAALCENTTVIAYEIDETRRKEMENNIKVNDLETKIDIKGFCDISSLKNDLNNNKDLLLLMDIDGPEIFFLDPILIPKLKNIDIIVECHDFVFSSITEILIDRFSPTHEINIIQQEARTLEDFPIKFSKLFTTIFSKYIANSINETRPKKNNWLILETK